MKINPDLLRKIKQTLEKNANFDEDKLTDILSSSNSLRMTKEVIKSGVREYFKTHHPNNGKEAANNKIVPETKNHQGDIDLEHQKSKKKVKKNQFLIQFADQEQYKFERLGGVQEILQKIQQELFLIIEHEQQLKQITMIAPNRGFLISGAMGSGKTILANCILSYLIGLKRQKVISAYSASALQFLGSDAEQKMKKIFQAAEENIPSIIFIDDVQELCSKENNKRMNSSPATLLCSFIEKIKDKEIYMLASTSSPEKLDSLTKPGLFYKPIRISNPDEEQRKSILQKILLDYKHNVQQHIIELSKMVAGFLAVDLVSFVKEATIKCIERYSKNLQQNGKNQLILELQDFKNAFKEVNPVLKKDGFAKIPTTKLSDVGALDQIKQELTQQIIMPLRDQQKFKNMNFDVNGGGILLYGPPGCGKTMIAKAIANEANANFITVKGPQLLTKYVGESEEAVRKVFERARMSAPCIIFFDEFDALAPKRQDQGNQVTERIVNTLLNQLNGVDQRKMVFVIAATNRPDIIDQAVLRSGRIEKHLYVPLPNCAERCQILEKITAKIQREEQLNLKEIAEKTDNFSGADLYFLVKKAIINAISENRNKVTVKDLHLSLESYKSDKYNKKSGFKMNQQIQEQSDEKEDELTQNLLGTKKAENVQKQDLAVQESMQNSNSKATSKKKSKEQNIMDEFLSFLMKKFNKN